ncbi:MAG TPA: biopolymer transporter ExbD [Rhodanobacteraceae bacterium]|nr:biopolymer transporter ExbD [Rhodanobacteraceae bacterium]
MAMSANTNSGGPMSEINVTPMVDVLLVLLIIFMIMAPLMQHQIKVDLPDAALTVKPAKTTQPMDLAIKADGSLYLNDSPINREELKARLAVAAQESPQPQVQIRADKTVEYREISSVMTEAKSVGIVHLGFITTSSGKDGG